MILFYFPYIVGAAMTQIAGEMMREVMTAGLTPLWMRPMACLERRVTHEVDDTRRHDTRRHDDGR